MKFRFTIVFVLFTTCLLAENFESGIYWVQFNTKIGTPYSINHPEEFLSTKSINRRIKQGIAIDSTDLPVNPNFAQQTIALGATVKHLSRWMNGAIVVVEDSIQYIAIKNLPFVDHLQLRKYSTKSATVINKFEIDDKTSYYGNSYRQISMLKGDTVHTVNRGEGITVGIIDAGFENADTHEAFDSLFARNGILGTFDVVNPGGDVYRENYHGGAVLSNMAALHPGELIGTAPMADYWLIRSEDVYSESPVEEDYWIVAAEFADSVGCDVINTSLGYSVFDKIIFNHSYNDYTGQTLRISKVANLAVDKGIVVVCSAGNSGNDAWKHIIAPSEAKNVLSVAAVNLNEEITSFSSWGFENTDGPPKPDVAAMGAGVKIINSAGGYRLASGTSFASPLLAGMAACLVSEMPNKTASEIIELIKKHGDRFPEHDIQYGFGIPDFWNAIEEYRLNKKDTALQNPKLFPNPFENNFVVTSFENLNTIRIFSIEGKLVYDENLGRINSNKYRVQGFEDMPKGIYLVEVETVSSKQIIKLIKQ